MRDDPQVLSRRLAAFVAPIPAKELARRINCDVRTAENIRRGHWPVARHWLGLIAAFGRDLTECVFHPEAAAERLQREAQELERKLAEVEAQLQLVDGKARSVSGTRPSGAKRPASARSKATSGHENGAAAVTTATPKRKAAA